MNVASAGLWDVPSRRTFSNLISWRFNTPILFRLIMHFEGVNFIPPATAGHNCLLHGRIFQAGASDIRHAIICQPEAEETKMVLSKCPKPGSQETPVHSICVSLKTRPKGRGMGCEWGSAL